MLRRYARPGDREPDACSRPARAPRRHRTDYMPAGTGRFVPSTQQRWWYVELVVVSHKEVSS